MIIRIYSVVPIHLKVSKTDRLVELHWLSELSVLENITCAFKNEASFVVSEIKSECSYYLEAKKKNQGFYYLLLHVKKIKTWSTQNSKQIYFLNVTLIKRKVSLIFLFCAFDP